MAELGPMEVAESCPTDTNADNALESISGRNAEKDVPNEKILKHTIRGKSPTSEQLASLNLKEGRNTVTFTFLTSMLGEQQVIFSCFVQLDSVCVFMQMCTRAYSNYICHRLMLQFICGDGTLVL